jgi:hypothetical protein
MTGPRELRNPLAKISCRQAIAVVWIIGCLGRFPQLVPAGHGGPRNEMKILEIGQNGGAGSGEIEISHGAIEAEQLFDPERD